MQALLAELDFTSTPSSINIVVPLKVRLPSFQMCCKQDQIIIVLMLPFCLIEI